MDTNSAKRRAEARNAADSHLAHLMANLEVVGATLEVRQQYLALAAAADAAGDHAFADGIRRCLDGVAQGTPALALEPAKRPRKVKPDRTPDTEATPPAGGSGGRTFPQS